MSVSISVAECWTTRSGTVLDIAIETSLMLRSAFKMAPRQTEVLMASVLTLMNMTITATDHTTVSRRAEGLTATKPPSAPKGALYVLIDSTGLQVFGAGQWLEKTWH